jgi:hypothetical protein
VEVERGLQRPARGGELPDRRSPQPDLASRLDNVSPTQRRAALAAGAGSDVIGLSIGLETAEDLIRDFDEAQSAQRPGCFLLLIPGKTAGVSPFVAEILAFFEWQRRNNSEKQQAKTAGNSNKYEHYRKFSHRN